VIQRPNPLLFRGSPGAAGLPARAIRHIGGPVQDAIDRILEIIHRSGYPALSGPQIGYNGRVVVVDLSRTGERPVVLINPEVESVSRETQVDLEGCIDLPGVRVRRERPLLITLRARARSGQPVRLEMGGLMGRIVQHQLDHLDGRLLLPRLDSPARGSVLGGRLEPPSCRLSGLRPGS